MSERDAVVIKQHISSGQTLKPIFIYSREECFDTPLSSQKSHQSSTLSVPRESPTIMSMPKNLPSYIMASECVVPNAQLVRRRIDYQETAEYRVVRPIGTDGRGDDALGVRKPLTDVEADFSKNITDDKPGSDTSSIRRRSRVSIAAPTDRVLRSQQRKGAVALRRDTNYIAALETETKKATVPAVVVEEDEENTAFTPLATPIRQTVIRRRADEIDAEEHGSHYSMDVTPPSCALPLAPPTILPLRSSYNGNVNVSTGRPWHLSSMLGLSAEPAHCNASLDGEKSRRRPSNSTKTRSQLHSTPRLASFVGCQLCYYFLNFIAIPLVLLHYLSMPFTAAGKAIFCTFSGLFRKTPTVDNSSNGHAAGPGVSKKHSRAFEGDSYTHSGLSHNSNGSKATAHRDHRYQRNVICQGISSLCFPLLLLLLLLAMVTLVAYLFRPFEAATALDDTPFLFGLLPSDAQCIRLARANTIISVDVVAAGSSSPPYRLRWNCLLWSLVDPSVAASKHQYSFWWNWTKSYFKWSPSAATPSSESFQGGTMLETIDNLLERLRVIDARMGDLNGQVVELKQVNLDRLTAHNKEYGIIGADINQLQSAVDSMKQHIALIASKVTEEGVDEERLQRMIDELAKQATFVSRVSLDARLQELRTQLEALISGGTADLAVQPVSQYAEHMERFEKTFQELKALVVTQKSDLEMKLKTLKQEFDEYQKDKTLTLEALNAKVTGDIVSAAAESRSDLASLEKRLVGDVEKISVRIGSIERLHQDLELALKKLTDEFASLRATAASQQSSSMGRIEELIGDRKESFSEQIKSDLKLKIMEELTSTSDSGTVLQIKLFNLIRGIVDMRLKETFASVPQSTTKDVLASGIFFDVFAPDGTGKADFALESAGGSVVSTRCTRTYNSFKSAISLFGITLAYWSRSPNEILQPGNQPGECWCFHGSKGQAIVRLAMPVHVTGISLEHIPKSLAHTGRIDSAPQDFVIKALESDSAEDGEVLGSFVYDEAGKPIQYFPVKARADGEPTLFVELLINSNHGHPDYTCVYRLRVHGHMVVEVGGG